MKKHLSKLRIRSKKNKDAAAQDANAPRITNETVAEHREEVLSSARKYIYPLQHSKHKIVLITTSLFVVTLIAFISYTTLSLYKLKSNSSFLYGVTKVFPFPVAKAGSDFVSYENYFFELNRYTHYYKTQQKLDFNTESGRQQLADAKKKTLDQVVNDAYVKQLAKQYKVTVSDAEVDAEIKVVQDQNRLGGSDKVFEDVIKEFYGWSVDDFKRRTRQQLLAQKLLPVLDPAVVQKANAAKAELTAGADFAATAKKYSDDVATKDNGGEMGGAIDRTTRDISAQTSAALFSLKPGEVSDVINAGYSLEIVKNIEVQGQKVRAAHIMFNFKDISAYLNDYKDKHKASLYIKL